MSFVGGVDVGSTQTKAIILDREGHILGRALINTGVNLAHAAEQSFNMALADADVKREQVGYVVGTGYGRYKVDFGDTQITEIGCHAKGACFLFPKTHTVIDIGGQDAKGIRVEKGLVKDFTMNDKCAAGTGRFLANAAEVLDISLDQIGPLSLQGNNPVRLTTVCTVFVESDIMSYLAQGKRVENILAGIHNAIANRTIAMVRRVDIEEEVTFTGGVSKNIGMVKTLNTKLKSKLNVSPESHYMGSLGAALFALEKLESRRISN